MVARSARRGRPLRPPPVRLPRAPETPVHPLGFDVEQALAEISAARTARRIGLP